MDQAAVSRLTSRELLRLLLYCIREIAFRYGIPLENHTVVSLEIPWNSDDSVEPNVRVIDHREEDESRTTQHPWRQWENPASWNANSISFSVAQSEWLGKDDPLIHESSSGTFSNRAREHRTFLAKRLSDPRPRGNASPSKTASAVHSFQCDVQLWFLCSDVICAVWFPHVMFPIFTVCGLMFVCFVVWGFRGFDVNLRTRVTPLYRWRIEL